jgi:hypothetical protein
MSEYVFGGAGDIDRAIALLVSLDNNQRNALAVRLRNSRLNTSRVRLTRRTFPIRISSPDSADTSRWPMTGRTPNWPRAC